MIEITAPIRTLPRIAVGTGVQLKACVGVCIAALIALEAWAAATDYGLRVTSDTPTFLPIVRDLGAHPFQAVSPFLDDSHVATSHATPYTQLLGSVWQLVAPRHDASGAAAPDPKALYAFLAVAGIVVTLLVLHAVFVWARSQAGSTVAWLTIPVLLVLFGPAQVIWAGDLTFHGFLYAAYFPQNVALALMCYALAALGNPPSGWRLARVALLVAATFTVHPFTGALLIALIAARGSYLAFHRSLDWITGSLAIFAGFGIALFWPAYSLNGALADAGLHGWVFVAACMLAPLVARGFEQPHRLLALGNRLALRFERPGRTRSISLPGLAVLGLVVVGALTVWEALLVHAGSSDPLIHTNRLAVYWVEDRWRWIPMLAGGALGLCGLAWLARRQRPLPAVWFASCASLGLLGVLGFSVPVWWRFLLFVQVPLALGLAQMLCRVERRSVAWSAAIVGLAVLVVVKVGSLYLLPSANTYFGTTLQRTYDLGKVIPAGRGLVATDPFTAFYVPGATGHKVLSVTKAHVNSNRELDDSQRGYALLHAFYSGPNWWHAAQQMYRKGVRYVVIAKQTSLAPTTLAEFSTGPTPLIRTAADRALLGQYFYRNNRVGTRLYDSQDFVVYRLDESRLWSGS